MSAAGGPSPGASVRSVGTTFYGIGPPPPNVAQLYGYEQATLSEGTLAHVLAMELVEGEDLAERLKRGAIPVDEAVPIARQIAEAVEEAHEKIRERLECCVRDRPA